MSNGVDYSSQINRIENKLENEINDRQNEDYKINNSLDRIHRELKGEIMALVDKLNDLIKDVNRNFNSFNNHLNTLVDKTEENKKILIDSNEELKTGNKKIVSGLEEVEKTSEEGLNKVSSGVAIVDVLKAMSEAQESGTAIVRSLNEIQNRLSQAELAVEEKKNEYDKHFDKVIEGYDRQLKIIGEHIQHIIDKIIPILNELNIDEYDDQKLVKVIEDAQAFVVEHRSDVLNKYKLKLDLDSLTKVQHLRQELELFLSDKNTVRLETDVDSNENNEIPVVNIPVIVSVVNENEYLTDSKNSHILFALDALAKDCYKKPEPKPEYFQLYNEIQSLASKIDKNKGVNLEAKTIDFIKQGIVKITKSGLLKEEHSKYVLEHIDKYPIKWLEF